MTTTSPDPTQRETPDGDPNNVVVVGAHLDSVPDGGWLDGILNVLAGVEVLRSLADEERPLTVKLVDWADEEGARFGRSLLGSSACGGTLVPDEERGRQDADGVGDHVRGIDGRVDRRARYRAVEDGGIARGYGSHSV